MQMAEPDQRFIAMLLYAGVAASDVAGPMECFGLANFISGRMLYRLTTVSADGETVAAAGEWMGLKPVHSFETLSDDIDTLLIPGGPAAMAVAGNNRIIDWLQVRAGVSVRVGSICNGAFILAASGIARGCRIATHWLYAAELARLHPDIAVDADAIYTHSDRIWSSGGMTSGMDMALAMIEADFGRALAMEVARNMVLQQRRSGGQSQFSQRLKAQFAEMPAISRLQQWIIDNPGADLRVETVAQHAAMSSRTLLRLFKAETGMPLGGFIAEIRLRHACGLLEDSDRELKQIAALAGLGSEANLRRVFMARLNTTPGQYRSRFRDGAAADPAITKAAYDAHWLHRTEVLDFRQTAARK
jgi:transcriptional regulator GlxA family with amidase domain